jgi:serine protease Do
MMRKFRGTRPGDLSLSAQHPANSFVQVVRKVRGGVVSILTEEEESESLNDLFLRLFLPDWKEHQETPTRHFGSGFVIHPKGYILTNEHVVRRAGNVSVRLYGYRHPLPARVVWEDRHRDLAVIKIQPPFPLPPLRLGSSEATAVGEWVIAVGNPLGLDHTVTVGVVSGKNRPLHIANRRYDNVIQTDAAINPGNSGGPLINILGEVVGINTLIIYPSQSIGFAIPIDAVKPLIRKFVQGIPG